MKNLSLNIAGISRIDSPILAYRKQLSSDDANFDRPRSAILSEFRGCLGHMARMGV